MSGKQNYQTLVDEYKKGAQFAKKLGTAGMLLQIGIIGFINGWKHLEIPYYNAVAPILFFLSIYYMVKDFLTFLKIEENAAQAIAEGVGLEKIHPRLGSFFHSVLQSFNLTYILMQRSLINVIALGCLGYLISEYIAGITSNFMISRGFVGLCVFVLGLAACKLYYDALKVLDEVKAKALAK